MGKKLRVAPIFENRSEISLMNTDSDDVEKFSGFCFVAQKGLKYEGIVEVGDKVALDEYYNEQVVSLQNENPKAAKELLLVIDEGAIVDLVVDREIKPEAN